MTQAGTGLPLDAHMVFALLFLMLGPIKILAPFVRMTQGTDIVFRRRLATRAIVYATIAMAMAAVMGPNVLERYGVPVAVLRLTGGIVLFLVALRTVLRQFQDVAAADAEPPSLKHAFSPLAFPTVVTPYGIATVIIFMALAAGDRATQAMVMGLVLLILALDWVAMLFAHAVLRWLGPALQISGVVLGVTQVAIGLHMMLAALAALGVIPLRVG